MVNSPLTTSGPSYGDGHPDNGGSDKLQNDPASDDLMTLALSRPEDRDATLLRAATALFCQEPSHDRDGVRRFEQLAVHLLPKITPDDRAYIASLLSHRNDAPAAVIRMLARDTIDIAAPALRHSSVLTTIDLLGVIAVSGPDHHRLIAGRTDLSADVLRALAIARTKTTGAEEEAGNDEVATPIAARPPSRAEWPIPPPTLPASNRAMPMPDFGSFLAAPREHRLWILAEASARGTAARQDSPIRKYGRLLRKSYALAEIVASAKRGDRTGMLAGFSSALGLATAIVGRLIEDPSGEPLVLMIKASGLSDADGNIVLLLGNKRIGTSVDEFFRLAALLSSVERGTAVAFIDAWRQPSLRHPPVHQPIFAENARGKSPSRPPAWASAAPARRARKS